jgi:hypothetical protein
VNFPSRVSPDLPSNVNTMTRAASSQFESPAIEHFVDKLKPLLEQTLTLRALGVARYTPIVDSIISTQCRDVSYIENTLDRLLDFAAHPGGLKLYRRLCRYYWDIDPAATAFYVNAYRQMWDNEDAEVNS